MKQAASCIGTYNSNYSFYGEHEQGIEENSGSVRVHAHNILLE